MARNRNYTRIQQRAYRDQRREHVERVAAILLGKRKQVPDKPLSFSGGSSMQSPFSYGGQLLVDHPRNHYIITGFEGV